MTKTQASPLERSRMRHTPHLPPTLKDLGSLVFQKSTELPCKPEITKLFPTLSSLPFLEGTLKNPTSLSPLRIGVVFSGGPAPGGHSVLSGLFDALEGGTLLGFLDGPKGILEKKYKELSKDEIDSKRNLGGFDLIGSGRAKISKEEDLEKALECCNSLALDGLIIIGGDDSNTNAAILANFFQEKGSSTVVIGVPKTIDADLKNPYIATSFGFDTACHVYSEIIGNICKDTKSSKKYTHFIKLMGREASHITLECALRTQPNYTLIGEEIEKEGKSLLDLTLEITDLIIARAEKEKEYSVILLPEGLLQFIPEFKTLIEELNTLLSKGASPEGLSSPSKRCFHYLPKAIQEELLLERDEHGNVPLSSIGTESLLADLVSHELGKRKAEGRFVGNFRPMLHFLGYEGRSAIPSSFDTDYCYCLGLTGASLVRAKATGYLACIQNLEKEKKLWTPGGVPIPTLMQMEIRKGTLKPVIKKTLVDLEDPAFGYFKNQRESWGLEDGYISPGPMQFYDNQEPELPLTLTLNTKKRECSPHAFR